MGVLNTLSFALFKIRVTTLIINSIEELLQRITEDNLTNEPVAFQTELQTIPIEIIDLIKQLYVGNEDNKKLRMAKQFSLRQQQCVDLLLTGMNNKEIANQLNLSVRTVEKYIATVKNRMNVRTRLELVLNIVRRKL